MLFYNIQYYTMSDVLFKNDIQKKRRIIQSYLRNMLSIRHSIVVLFNILQLHYWNIKFPSYSKSCSYYDTMFHTINGYYIMKSKLRVNIS